MKIIYQSVAYCNILRYGIVGLIFIFLLADSGCKKFVDVASPITGLNSNIVFSSDATAIATLNNIYSQMSQDGIGGGLMSMSLFPGLSADELQLADGVLDEDYLTYYHNSLISTTTGRSDFWSNTYSKPLYLANAAIEGLNSSHGLTPSVKNQLIGEALFVRAFCNFYLVNLYGDIPLVLTTDYKVNSYLSRSPVSAVYGQIIKDLKTAKGLLSENFMDGTLLKPASERIAPTKWAAEALLARVYLFMKDFLSSENEATSVINNNSLFDLVDINSPFLINNKESIWQLQSVSSYVTNTSDANLFILPSTGPATNSNPVYLTNELVKSFEAGDLRRQKWIDSVIVGSITYYYPFKYKELPTNPTPVERTVILRLAEQYLIRAEARAMQNNIDGALADLNKIRKRAGLSSIASTSKDEIISRIVQERRVELFTEWGHRWLDLKRLDLADRVLQPIKGSSWQSTDQLYPIPISEIQKDPNLNGRQNPGY